MYAAIYYLPVCSIIIIYELIVPFCTLYLIVNKLKINDIRFQIIRLAALNLFGRIEIVFVRK